LRHARIVELARSFHAERTLDLGCSLGQLTIGLAELPGQLFAGDLSPTAVARARENVRIRRGNVIQFAAVRSTALPFRNGVFDLVIASDGLYSWDIGREERALALDEIVRAMTAGGYVILTDHMRRSRFKEFIGEISATRLRVDSVFYLHDRPAYQLESWLKAVRTRRVAKALRRSIGIATILSGVGRLFGTRGARHVGVIARKP
jgi:SAM-dependent methyltransferase